MALREIRILGDDILRKKCKVVKNIDEKVLELVKDMEETMINGDGVGIAAPQVGVLKRIILVMDGKKIFTFINPVILEKEGEEIDVEGCLSVKKRTVKVARPKKIKLEALDIDGKKVVIVAENYFARVICHEVDHLDGVLIVDRAI